MVEVRRTYRNVTHERCDTRELVVIDVLCFVGHLVVIAVATRREENNRDAVSRVLVVIAAAVVLLGVAVRVKLVVELERRRLRLCDRLYEITKLGRQPTRTNQLQISRPSTFHVIGSTTTDHVDVELRDD